MNIMVQKSEADLLYNEKLVGKIIENQSLSDSQTVTTIRNINEDLANMKTTLGRAHII